MARFPKPLGDLQRANIQIMPPGYFVAGLVQLPMMTAAERYSELVTDFETEGPGLGKAQMMRIGWLAPADQAWL